MPFLETSPVRCLASRLPCSFAAIRDGPGVACLAFAAAWSEGIPVIILQSKVFKHEKITFVILCISLYSLCIFIYLNYTSLYNILQYLEVAEWTFVLFLTHSAESIYIHLWLYHQWRSIWSIKGLHKSTWRILLRIALAKVCRLVVSLRKGQPFRAKQAPFIWPLSNTGHQFNIPGSASNLQHQRGRSGESCAACLIKFSRRSCRIILIWDLEPYLHEWRGTCLDIFGIQVDPNGWQS